MVTVIVNFPIPAGLSLEDFNAQMLKSVPKYQAMPGLVRKSYIIDSNNRVAAEPIHLNRESMRKHALPKTS